MNVRHPAMSCPSFQSSFHSADVPAGLPACGEHAEKSDAKNVYFSLLPARHNNCASAPSTAVTSLNAPGFETSHLFLSEQLVLADTLSCDMPTDWESLQEWIERGTEEVGHQYREYLDARKSGAKRKYFTNKSHALYFLKSVAPTKLVDGAWLYGVTKHWNDPRFSTLIKIYLEELGEGLPDKNHVVLYNKLLESHGCEQWPQLDADYFVQGAIQLSLAYHASDFLPEVIGFNLGYEQLPLHLLITAYELNELGIDPYYFTLHVTVDNAATGHAKKSLQGVFDALPQVADRAAFYQRLMNGYKLNMLGVDTLTAIKSFDLQQELLSVLISKAGVGSLMHSDYCRVGGRTVNAWLSEAGQLPAFLESLEQCGWIKRHQDPQNSRFWGLIHGEHAEMFGVFNAYEQQLIYDWILGDAVLGEVAANGTTKCPRQLSFKAQQRLSRNVNEMAPRSKRRFAPRGVIRSHFSMPAAANDHNDFNEDLRLLEERLANLSSKEELMENLIALMSPAHHHTVPGLMATRIFARLFNT